MRWTPKQLPDLTGRTYVVTGASSGIGLTAARHLANRGARVIAGVRAPAKMRGVMDFDADVRPLDLADLESVRRFALSLAEPVHVLINNAGVMAVPLLRTADGFELQFGTNHLGHFALTGLLLDRITDRIVTVSSAAHTSGKIQFDDLNWHGSYQRWPAYAQSKLANLLFTHELQRRLTATGSKVRAVAAHPGWAATGLQRGMQSVFWNGLMSSLTFLLAQSDDQGAWPTLFAAVEALPGNAYVGPDGLGGMRGHPVIVDPAPHARDDATARKLWAASEELTRVTFPQPKEA